MYALQLISTVDAAVALRAVLHSQAIHALFAVLQKHLTVILPLVSCKIPQELDILWLSRQCHCCAKKYLNGLFIELFVWCLVSLHGMLSRSIGGNNLVVAICGVNFHTVALFERMFLLDLRGYFEPNC